jgi:hypothetical protein
MFPADNRGAFLAGIVIVVACFCWPNAWRAFWHAFKKKN